MKKRIICLLLALAACFTVLTACSSKSMEDKFNEALEDALKDVDTDELEDALKDLENAFKK